MTEPEAAESDRTTNGSAGSTLQTVSRAVSILRELTAEHRPLTVVEVAGRVGLNRTVTHRLLQTLAHEHMVQERGGRYLLGEDTYLLGTYYLDSLAFRTMMTPFMIDIQNRVVRNRPWITSLAIPIRGHIVLIDRLWNSAAPLDAVWNPGTRSPLDNSATGRAVLAHLNEDDAIDRLGVGRYTDVAPILEQVRRNEGLAIFRFTRERAGTGALAVAVRNPVGFPIAAIGVSGIELEPFMFSGSEVAQQLLRSVAEINQNVRDRW